MRPLVALLCLAGVARGHHGQDFFVNLDARVPALGAFTAFANASAAEGEFVLEPGLMAGLGAGFGLGLSADFSDDGSFHAAGITPMLQGSTAVGDSSLRLGASLAWHLADSSRLPAGGHGGHGHGSHTHSRRAAVAAGRAATNPDAPPTPAPQAAAPPAGSTIHLHDTDYLATRLIAEWECTRNTRLVGNLILAGTSGSDLALGYSFGIRHELGTRWALGLEGIGDFDTGGYHELIGSVVFSPRRDLGLRAGVGHGLGPSSGGASLLTGVTFRF